MMIACQPPINETELLERCQVIEGMSFSQLAGMVGMRIPDTPTQRKGWAGQALELVLGASAGSRAEPDFVNLGIELKTLPLNHSGKPSESTFVTTIPLLTVHRQTWKTSQCFAKLRRVLWVTLEGDRDIPFHHRRMGRAILWSPEEAVERVLADDWAELTWMIGTGRLEEIDASMGEYLQVRPKGANAKSLCYGFDEAGNKTLTLPRGFYLRSRFTESHVLT
jgi:DNA mismatch repair protein MutH